MSIKIDPRKVKIAKRNLKTGKRKNLKKPLNRAEKAALKRMQKEELKAQEVQAQSLPEKIKERRSKRKRAKSEWNKLVGAEICKAKKANPKLSQREIFKKGLANARSKYKKKTNASRRV